VAVARSERFERDKEPAEAREDERTARTDETNGVITAAEDR
jgi:hypothetical protein